ncbi:head-tail connector protein [Sphingomonas abietis]|uniref:Head-tail connector protein n=1 Tax=Sphingomonas abietis TaxID=3012344 RepID=A0ABY7NQX3_9SPHN|nr:head-tail connector protein [Sphingomonas abietis]WBO23936.1 head-tail connector protein [Sphingomonas abietis]
MTEPVSLDQLKVHLRLEEGETDEDAYLTGMIMAARRACEYQINRSVVGATDVLNLDIFPGEEHSPFPIIPLEACSPRSRDICLAGGMVASVTSVTYFDEAGAEQTLDPSTYFADLVDAPALLAPVGRSWPKTQNRPGAVTITYLVSPLTADDLATVAQAMLLLIGHWYRNRESVAVDIRGTPIELPLSVTWLLTPLRQWATD